MAARFVYTFLLLDILASTVLSTPLPRPAIHNNENQDGGSRLDTAEPHLTREARFYPYLGYPGIYPYYPGYYGGFGASGASASASASSSSGGVGFGR